MITETLWRIDMKFLKLGLTALFTLPTFCYATSFGSLQSNSISSYSSSQAGLSLPACSFDYTNIGIENIQRVAFYVTNDVLDYATREEVRQWIDTQVTYSNQGLKNSCVEFQQEVAVVRFVETPDDQPDYGDNFVYSKEDLTADLYQSIIASLDVDDNRVGVTTPMGRTGEIIKADWVKLSFDRVVNVRPYYKATPNLGPICGVGYGNWSRPNKAEQTWLDAPENYWGESQVHSDAFATVVYPNDPICSSPDLIAHELGHTNGLSHERPSKPANDYEDTLGFAASCNGEHSIMWSGTKNHRSVPFFSSPDVESEGIPCGEPATSFGVDSTETLKFQLGTSYKHSSPRNTPYQGAVDAGSNGSVGDTSTWNTITSNRFDNMTISGTTDLGSVPVSVNELDGSVSFVVNRTDTSDTASVIVRSYGDGNIVSGVDIDSEQTAEFSLGESSKTVTFNLFDSGLYRQNGTVTFKIEAAYQTSEGSSAEESTQFIASRLGESGTVSLGDASYSCDASCEGSVELKRTGGDDGDISVDVVYRLDGTEVKRQTVAFGDGQVNRVSTITHADLDSLTVDLESSHPSLVQYSRATFVDSNNGGTTPTPTPDPSEGGSSGGSLGFWPLALCCLLFRRNKLV